ncbi:MAG: septal ring lytic transglycosylase RlpA family protein [Proteobacteria bacterium]|nr:septal ring lytic transglycosylase RlpA family protein [Pseudomonadota bacterium]MBU1139444.1 septal ring lytic transglycosylase RlpA family protein [Pseudomonadota bacterium]MBU1233091.1 septal ring lytic transglycosylase RlpA family protein [Pseudomonadota bacterium]MBU1419635.1 septal ring lytic transglycosylase RlpA family protein [Pseudomonadota bacterium]MBU1453427.1 septal ring lytic transglycosylase RlpA family protein [Pseudomonadota bacterium]
MFEYQVQKGDTIAQVTRQLGTNWESLRKSNPEAIGRSRKNGNWFLKEGATVNVDNSFKKSLQQAEQQRKSDTSETSVPISIPQPWNNALLMADAVSEDSEPEQKATDPLVIEHTIQAGETLWGLAVKKYHVHVNDIMKDNGITDPTTLQIGQIIKIHLPEKTGEEQVVASWYGQDFHGKPMANGDIYDMYGATIAHKEIPLGTKVELKNKDTGEKVQAVVTDRGPYIEGRDVDLSYGLAKKLSLVDQGVGSLVMRIL